MHIPPWLLLTGVVLVLPLLLCYAVWAYSYGPKLAGRQLGRVLLIAIVVIGSVVAFLACIPASWKENTRLAIELLATAGLFVWPLVCLICRTKPGGVLLNIRRSSHHISLIVFAGTVLLLGLGSGISEAIAGSLSLERIVQVLGLVAIATSGLYLGFSRIQLTERGILCFLSLIKWEDITAYRWEEGKRTVLALTVSRRLPLFREVNIPIPPRCRDFVDSLLLEKGSRSTSHSDRL
jgi:hypothetical protein